jgi:hypothetical protein
VSTRAVLRATQDSYTNVSVPNRNYGQSVALRVRDNSGAEQRTFVGFSLKVLPSDAVVFEATLRLHLRGTWSGSSTITARRVTQKWSEKRLTNANAPNTTATNAATAVVASGSGGDVLDIDVTDLVGDAVGGANWHGIRLTSSTSGSNAFNSSEVSKHDYRPRLIIIYGVQPDAPSQLNPRGGNAVNASKPKLSWTITGEQSASQVQVHTTDDFTTPDYDSDWVVNTEPMWDLDAATSPTFSAITDGDERYWRVRFKDEDGIASDWSLTARFERQTYGAFSVVSPATDGDPVLETTPTIITDLTGRTQTRIGWRVFKLSPGTTEYVQTQSVNFSNGAVTSDPSFELEAGAIDDLLAIYIVYARAWDEFDRGTAVGETSFIQTQRAFVYSPTSGVTGVADLAADPLLPHCPAIELTWTRAAAPDSYDIYVDGLVIEQNIDPADVFVTGTSYSYTVWTAAPSREHTYTVVPKENGEDSDTPGEITLTNRPIGIWLMAPEDEILVALYQREEAQMSIGEEATTFNPSNRRDPVRIQDSVRGLEGTVSGMLIEALGGPTAQEWRDALLRIKGLSPDTPVRLALGRQNFPITVGSIEVSPDPDEEEHYAVSVGFWQSGEFEVDV